MIPIRPAKPGDSLRFCTSLAAVLLVVSGVLLWRGKLAPTAFLVVSALVLTLVAVAWWRPRCADPVYRAGMLVATALGMVLGPVLLTLVFFLVVAPVSLLLRIAGRDLLHLKRSPRTSSWHPSKVTNEFDRMF